MQVQNDLAPRVPANAHPEVIVVHNKFRSTKKSRITYSYLTNGTTVTYGVAFCAPSDMFSRKIGRQIAQGRLKSNPITIHNVDTTSGRTINETIRSHIMANLPHNWQTIVWLADVRWNS